MGKCLALAALAWPQGVVAQFSRFGARLPALGISVDLTPEVRQFRHCASPGERISSEDYTP